MWTCHLCDRRFVKPNQAHSCNDKVLAGFLNGKSPHTVGLFEHLLNEFQLIGDVSVHATKSMIVFGAGRGFAYIIQLGKTFVDVVFPFNRPYNDNLCFNKIKQVPGTSDYNHHLRIFLPDDINDEVRGFMRLAYKNGGA
jgi:hypothetical protein